MDCVAQDDTYASRRSFSVWTRFAHGWAFSFIFH